MKKYSLGIDYGTNSVRSLLVDIATGEEIASAVYSYPSGEKGILTDAKNPLIARQNPREYIEGFIQVARRTVRLAQRKGICPSDIIGIGIDTTGSTPLPVDRNGIPLAFLPEFQGELAAQAWLWKDHSACEEGEFITDLAKKDKNEYLNTCGGIYSSEWIWAKVLHCKKENPRVFKAAYSWVECADFVPAYITGNLKPETLVRGICSAGHKALYHEKWGGLPSEKFFAKIDPDLVPYRSRFAKAVPSDSIAGYLTEEMAKKAGLPKGIPVAVGAIDAHLGALGAGIKTGTLVEVIGTSSCEMLVCPLNYDVPDIPGLSGIVPGSIVPGMFGFEAGQPAVGDIFNWFVSHVAAGAIKGKRDPHLALTKEASSLLPGENGLIALDWNNGNRCLLGNSLLTGLLIGQTLQTTAAEIYRALIEATAFGGLTIINRFEEYHIPVKQVVFTGGIAEKNPLLLQIYADIYNRPVMISRSGQTCALGAAILGSVVGGGYRSVLLAQKKMCGIKPIIYKPDRKASMVYRQLYKIYHALHDSFGGTDHAADLSGIMNELTAIRNQVRLSR
ncbi:MAG: ribulokinase [Planctomycetia bacterium]|nr:ribulokinase [Planctomycetia bacterium]